MSKRLVTRTFTFEGKRYYVRASDPEAAAAKAALKLKELEEDKRRISKHMSVSAWAEEWLRTYKEPVVNSRHCKDIEGIINNFIDPNIGAMQIRNVRPVHLQRILTGITHYSDSYISKIYDVICQIFREAYLNDLVITDPAEALKKPSGKKKKKRRPITPMERKLTLQVAETYRGGTFVLLMLYCGLRPGEVAALTWRNVDLNDRVIHVRQALKADGTIDLPKTDAGYRDVPIPTVLAKRLRKERGKSLSYVCTNSKGGRYTASSFTAMFEVYRHEMNKAAGCKTFRGKVLPPFAIGDDLTLYCYRHTYCTDLQAAGVPINVAKELMGHSNISVTAQIYTHKSEAAFNNAADLIDAYVTAGVAPKAEDVEKCANSL